MTKLIGRTLQEIGEVVIAPEKLAAGGEGQVYNVLSHELNSLSDAENLVAKIYFKPNEANRGPKVSAMIANPPEEQTSIARVEGILFDNDKKFVGYLMKKLDTKNFRQWSELSNTKDRKQTSPEFDVRYALNASRNFLVAIHFIHEAGHRVGDINESNLFVNTDSTVMLVDMDSAQISNGDKTYACEVGKPEFTSAELKGKLKDTPRTVETDIFAYSVMMFQMLTGGAHPMDGIFVPNEDPPNVTEKIRMGVLPTLKPGMDKRFKPVSRIPAKAIPTRLQNIMVQSLSNNPSDRPDSETYIQVVDDVLANLVQCNTEKRHWFDKRDKVCGWCLHKKNGNFDPWSENDDLKKPKSNLSQSSLPSVSFGDQVQAPQARRAAPRVNRTPNAHQSAQNSPQPPQSASGQHGPANPSQTPQSAAQGFTTSAQPSPTGSGSAANPQNVYPSMGQMLPYRTDPPQKHKGKIVLEYMDGSIRQRPSLGDLVKQDRKMAWHAFKEEFPNPIRPWWDKYRYTAKTPAIIIGFILSLAVASSWFFTVPMLNQIQQIPQFSFNKTFFFYFAVAAVGTSALASFNLLFTALLARRKDIKTFGVDSLQEESFAKTALRFIAVALFYGPVFLVVLLIGAIFGLFNFFSAAAKAT